MKHFWIALCLVSLLAACGAETDTQTKQETPTAEADSKEATLAADTSGKTPSTDGDGEVSSTATTSPTSYSGPAKIAFTRTSHNFGTHKVGDSVFTFFDFKNVGGEPLQITNAKPSCSCTGVQYPKGKSFGPGEGGRVRVSYPTKDKVGFNAKNVLIFTNGDKTPVKLSFQLEVEE
jgi:hypothetical protein